MINFPIFEKLEVDNFGLYPGKKGAPGLLAGFKPGLTLILGANGLGKTTLVTILFRMLTGPFDIPALTKRTDLGNAKLNVTPLSIQARRIFAQRVSDGATDAVARLHFTIGGHDLLVERQLQDLSLTRLVLNSEDQDLDDRDIFQTKIAQLAGVWSFGDWILLLRHMVFYFEDRRELVWDASAQRQLLRTLLLKPDFAQRWTQEERAILELDSRMRNLRFAAYREEQAFSEVETKIEGGAHVQEELKTLETLQETDIEHREILEKEFTEYDSQRQFGRLRLLRAKQERESRYRAFENAKLRAVEARFPQKSETARYILEQLYAETECLVCGNHAPQAVQVMQKRIDGDDCIVCGTHLSSNGNEIPAPKLADKRVAKASASLSEIEPELEAAELELNRLENSFESSKTELAELDAKISERTARIDLLVRSLPPDQQDIHKQRSELASMRARVEMLTDELEKRRNDFSKFVDTQNRKMARKSTEIMASFSKFASGFLLETVELAWSPQRAKLGQTGEPIEFPGFELDMSGADFPTKVRRSGPENVSESQREFIDLAFRMALMHVASDSGDSSLIIDAPESSLDAVFVTRAADVLAAYGNSKLGNRLITTSNLVEGDLIPELLRRSTPAGKRKARIVDLFAIAEPTAAIRELRDEYSKIFKALLAKIEAKPKRQVVAKSTQGSRKK